MIGFQYVQPGGWQLAYAHVIHGVLDIHGAHQDIMACHYMMKQVYISCIDINNRLSKEINNLFQ